MLEIYEFGKERENSAKIPDSAERISSLSGTLKKRMQAVLDFVNAGLVPNLMGTISASVAAINNDPWIIGINSGAALYNYTAAFSKYREYRKIKASLEKHGWDERIVKPKSYTFCQRWAAYL